MTNEIITVDQNTGEITELQPIVNHVVRETKDYMIVKLPNGKFEKRMKYHELMTFKPETEEEEIELYKVLNEDDVENVIPMKNAIGTEIVVKEIITRPYESFDEETGDVTFGVNTFIKDDHGNYLVTSSKAVYFNLIKMYQTFGLGIKVKITGTKRENGTQIGISFIGK